MKNSNADRGPQRSKEGGSEGSARWCNRQQHHRWHRWHQLSLFSLYFFRLSCLFDYVALPGPSAIPLPLPPPCPSLLPFRDPFDSTWRKLSADFP